MQREGTQFSRFTVSGVLCACAKFAVLESKQLHALPLRFDSMPENDVTWSSMVAGKGLVEEAKDLIENMPFAATPSMWGSVLASCRVHGNVEVAEIAAKHLFELEPNNAKNHVLLSNIYASKRRWRRCCIYKKTT
ncbi:hypothetical protein HAX54_015952 [Datura stramonium]|uniref:Pentatricopeptide repeat-containing protein n=1 Tax=Datura stramonium TaxID=4076 RepID=A0ABS8UI40_DATST|nr:hypothetical protein [Datura stramonium]